MAIGHFLKINDDFLTNSNTKPYSRFYTMRVLIYKRKRIETNVTEANVTKCYGHPYSRTPNIDKAVTVDRMLDRPCTCKAYRRNSVISGADYLVRTHRNHNRL